MSVARVMYDGGGGDIPRDIHGSHKDGGASTTDSKTALNYICSCKNGAATKKSID